jgi:hypothetical protein
VPSRYIHLHVARRALSLLADNPRAAALFASDGPSADDVSAIARDHPAYVALGAIGPDFFFPYPDFKPPHGLGIWAGFKTLDVYYTAMEDLVWGPTEAVGSEEFDTNEEAIDDLATAGRARERRRRKALALTITNEALFGLFLVVVPELIGFSVSNVAQAYDEQGFAWSDMLHYRRTYEFAARLWRRAREQGNERFQAFALGWMTHLATDVTGHGFVNQKCGGPWRLHWQRHQLIESHMDGLVYADQYGQAPIYNAISCSAMHLWIAFESETETESDDSLVDFFETQPGRDYDPGPRPAAALDRTRAWDAPESEFPEDLARFLVDVLEEVYGPEAVTETGQWAAHPKIVNDYDPPSQGFPTVVGIQENYRRVCRWVKQQTTDYYRFRPPEEPPAYPQPWAEGTFPMPPPPPEFDDRGPGAADESLTARAGDVVTLVLALAAPFRYMRELVDWAEAVLAAWNPVTATENWVKRWFEYWFIDLPLYNAMLTLHWYFSLNNITLPLPHEVNPGLTTLGVGVDMWAGVRAALAEPRGGLDRAGPPAGGTEPSGLDKDRSYPRDVVTDPAREVTKRPMCASSGDTGPAPSEYLSPWLFPLQTRRTRRLVPSELPHTTPGPHTSGQDARVLVGGAPGDAAIRQQFEEAQNERRTIVLGTFVRRGRHLGDCVDYTADVVAKLTRDHPGAIANFNLDADRGYGSLCWDWVRSKDVMATPAAWTGFVPGIGTHEHRVSPRSDQPSDPRAYHAPLRPGFGWCPDDLAIDNAVDPATLPAAEQPLMHDPTPVPNDPGQVPVRVRYLDRERK